MSKLERILYLEDVPEIAEVTEMALETIDGFDVLLCSSGEEALARAEGFHPQLFLFDVMLNGMSGPETAAQLKQNPAMADVPVVYVTAKAQLHEQAAYMESGALGVIVKPFDPLTIGAQIERLWSGN